jgi:endoglucanase
MPRGFVPVLCLALVAGGTGCGSESDLTPPIIAPTSHLGRGINLGNKLEAPSEGEWGAPVEAWMLPTIAQGGFATVRIPIRWSGHAATAQPYAIDPTFMDRVTWVVDQALSAGLTAVLNVHHYQEIFTDPARERDRFLALWRQISARFRDYPEALVFEILNEPNTNLTAQLWNVFLRDALAVIRQGNPDRWVVVGTAEWGGIGAMDRLELPDDDRLIFTFHYYEPFEFTHQGAEWGPWTTGWLGPRSCDRKPSGGGFPGPTGNSMRDSERSGTDGGTSSTTY